MNLPKSIVGGILTLLFPCLTVTSEEGGDLNAQTTRAFHARSWKAARVLADSAWAAYSPSKDPLLAGVAAANLGGVHAFYGRLGEAASYHDKAEGLLGSATPDLIGKLARARAIAAFVDSRQFGNLEPEDAIAEMVKASESLGSAEIEPCHAEVLGQSNQGNRVQDGYIKYLGLISQVEGAGDSLAVADCVSRLGRIEGSSGGHGSAAGLFERARRIYEEAGDSASALLAERNVGIARWKLGKHDAALVTLAKSLKTATSAGDDRLRMMLLNDHAMVLASIGQEKKAIGFDRQADEALLALSQGLRSGKYEDSVLFDFSLLLKMRYTGKATYVIDLFPGFYEHLTFTPEG